MSTPNPFDPDAFLSTSFTDANDTKVIPLPENEYTGTVEDVKVKQTPKGSHVLEVYWRIAHPELASEIGRENSTVRQELWLDTTSAGQLDFSRGRNVSLGRLRSAVGQNTPGASWMIANLKGAVAKVRVRHDVDKDDPEIKYPRVKAVAAL